MFEIIIAAAIVIALSVAAMVPPMTLLWIGVGAGALGVALGLPSGFIYHAQLWRALRAEGRSTEGMWLRPYLLHAGLSDQHRGPIQAWFTAGAAGFVMTVLGGVGVITAVVRLAGA